MTFPRRTPLFRPMMLLSGAALAWIAIVIYASSNSIVALLLDIGEQSLVTNGYNAITHSNLLVLGSLLSIPVLVGLYRHDLTRAKVSALTGRDWKVMTLAAVLSSALTPGLFFYALAHTSVTKVVMIGRIEPPLFLLAAYFLLNERFSPRVLTASIIAAFGAFVIIAGCDGTGTVHFGAGEWAAVGGTVSYVASTLVTRRGVQSVPMGLFFVYRTGLGCAVYVAVVCTVFGPQAFANILSPVLWSWIWIYAGLALVLAPIVWSLALKHAKSDDLTLASSFAPLAGVIFAIVLVGEAPSDGLVLGSAIILLSIAYARGVMGMAYEFVMTRRPSRSLDVNLPLHL
ncbi:MAG: DMT family transporter [Pseudomonadota bacterium]